MARLLVGGLLVAVGGLGLLVAVGGLGLLVAVGGLGLLVVLLGTASGSGQGFYEWTCWERRREQSKIRRGKRVQGRVSQEIRQF